MIWSELVRYSDQLSWLAKDWLVGHYGANNFEIELNTFSCVLLSMLPINLIILLLSIVLI